MRSTKVSKPRHHSYPNFTVGAGILLMLVGSLVVPIYTASTTSLRRTDEAPNLRRIGGSGELSASARFSTLTAPVPFFVPGITTLESTCTTPKTDFVLGETICARVTEGTTFPRRLTFVDPSGFIRQTTAITSDPQDITFNIPETQTSDVGTAGNPMIVDNRGSWRVNMISSRATVVTTAKFVVTDPAAAEADLIISKSATVPNQTVSSGGTGTFQISVINNGPNDAVNVTLTDVTPANTSLGVMTQTSGPSFSCVNESGTITCTRASLTAGSVASFDFTYLVDIGLSPGTIITNTATVFSDTTDSNTGSNSSTATATVGAGSGTGGTTCSVGCPDDITVEANTTQSGQDGAVVHFSPPTGNDECGPIVVSHCNDCFFAVGITTVTATASTGENCAFDVTVHPPNTGNATIVCPSNKTANADPADCDVAVAVGTPVVSGTNVTFHGVRSDGRPMYNCDCFPNSPNQVDDACNVNGACTRKNPDALFPPGVTTITWIAYTHDIAGPYATPEDEEAHRNGSASCTQTITVNDVTPPVITATNSSASADANCQAPVPDYSTTASDNCACSNSDNSNDCEGHPHFTYTQTPAAGTMVGIGPHTVHITVNDNSSNPNPGPDGIFGTGDDGTGNISQKDVTFTVNDTTAPTVTAPADSSASADANCQAPVPNYAASSTASDNCDSSLTLTQSPAAGTMVGLGPHTVTVSTTDDAGNTGSDTVVFTVNDTTAPVIICPAPVVHGTDAGSCSAIVNPGQPTTTDNCDSSVTITSTRSDGQAMNAPYPRGTTTITWRATDDSGNYSECQQTVTVFDDDGPTFTFTAMQTMWPPNHKYKAFTIANLVASVQDNCDGNLPLSGVVITKVTSDEIENGNGDGNTMNDIVIAADCKSVQLRSEREGSGNGRVYTIFFSATDAAGNKGVGFTRVVVPHNPGETAVDSGPHYTVMSNCP